VSDVPKTGADVLMTVGWVLMIPSQSIVLWSRLQLVTRNKTLIRSLLCLIIVDSVLLIIPTCVFNWGALLQQRQPYLRGYMVIEKIQMCVFSAQEILISGVYLFEVWKIAGSITGKKAISMVKQLIMMNVLIIVLDITILVIEFCNYFMIQVTLKALVYSVKLKVEFAVLSKIISLVRERRTASELERAEAAAIASVAKRKIKSPTPISPDSPTMLLGDPEKLVVSPRVSAASTTRFNSFNEMGPRRVQSMDSGRIGRLPSYDGSVDTGLQYPGAAAIVVGDEYEARYMRSLQQNVPADWRLSIGHEALSGPNLYEIRQLSHAGLESDEDAIESVHDMYPGRLG
jgi:hypothetical protein